MLSSRDSANPTTVTSRASHGSAVKPVVVDNYNQSMNGVDLVDQLLHSKKEKSGGIKCASGFSVSAYILFQSSVVMFSKVEVLLNHWPNFRMLLLEQCNINILLVISPLLVI